MQPIEQTLGPQTVSIKGIPADSHFARVIIAADYQMKRLAMNFDPSPVKGLPSFLQMMKSGGGGSKNMMQRWWLEPNYQALLVSPDELAFEIRGASVKAMTEEDFVAANGSRKRSGKASPLARKWADNMTAHYDELAGKNAVFGQLRNCIDLAVVSALIVKDRLPEKAHYSMSVFLHDDQLVTEKFNSPKQIASQASVVQKGDELADQRLGRSADVLLAIGRKGRAEPRPGPGTPKGGPARRWPLVVELKKTNASQALVARASRLKRRPNCKGPRVAPEPVGGGQSNRKCLFMRQRTAHRLLNPAWPPPFLAAMSVALFRHARSGPDRLWRPAASRWCVGRCRRRAAQSAGRRDRSGAGRPRSDAQPVPADARQLGLRKVSLRRLEEAIAEHLKTGQPLDDEMKYLAGLQHIQYVFVYPELGDIVLAGPGEGWKINHDGDLVGLTTGRPVMWLDDLLVALRTAEATRQTGISCSIDPTNEGVVRVNALFDKMARDGFEPPLDEGMRASRANARSADGFDQRHSGRQPFRPRDHCRRLSDEAAGDEFRSFAGERLAEFSADDEDRRRRLEKHDAALVAGAELPVAAGLARRIGVRNSRSQRQSDDRGRFRGGQRRAQRSGKASPLARKWADNMTAHYDELAGKNAVFGQLRTASIWRWCRP